MVQNDQDPEIQEGIGAKVLCVDDEEEKAPEIKSNRETLQMAENLLEYARCKGNEKLSLVLSKSTVLLQEIVIRNHKQSSIYDYFKKLLICAQRLKKSMYRAYYHCCFAIMFFHLKY